MFSGIIERLGRVSTCKPQATQLVCTIETGFKDLELGESVAVNGVCLTVAELESSGSAAFFVSNETLDKTNLAKIAVGNDLNLERSVKLETRLSGHLVQGHVDGKARFAGMSQEGESRKLGFDLPNALARYCVTKGSIALNGISLTVNELETIDHETTRLFVTIIPHTWEHTNLHNLKTGDAINVEVDVIAKYVERLCQPLMQH
jgi:riboflavin synthase